MSHSHLLNSLISLLLHLPHLLLMSSISLPQCLLSLDYPQPALLNLRLLKFLKLQIVLLINKDHLLLVRFLFSLYESLEIVVLSHERANLLVCVRMLESLVMQRFVLLLKMIEFRLHICKD